MSRSLVESHSTGERRLVVVIDGKGEEKGEEWLNDNIEALYPGARDLHNASMKACIIRIRACFDVLVRRKNLSIDERIY